MASPAAPSPDSGLAAVQSSAASNLAAALASDEATPSPDPTPAPPPQAPPAAAPAVAAPAAPPPAATPQAPPAGQAPASTTIDINGLSPEARRFLEMKDGDVDRALRDALDYNNRLAAVSRPGAATPPAPGAPPAPPQAPGTAPAAAAAPAPGTQVPPAPSTVPEPQAIETEVDQWTGADQECVRLANEYGRDNQTIKALDAKYPNLESEIAYHTRRLLDPDVKDDSLAQEGIKETLRELKEARTERRDLVRNVQEVTSQFDGRADQYRQRINARYDAQRAQAESDAQVERHAEALTVAWNPGVTRAATKHKIPESLQPKFEVLSRQAALANLELGFTVNDLDTFLDQQATGFLEVMDQSHRELSAQYGDLARTRAAQPGPGEGIPAVATAQAPVTDNLNDVYKAARARLEGRV